MAFSHGKLPNKILKEVVFKNLGFKRKEVILGPTPGIDGTVMEAGSRSLIVSMDPVTGALERIGWIAVNVNANDVATFGVEPSFLFSCILLPEDSKRNIIEAICSQMDKAAKGLEIAIAGGHCEVTPGIASPIVVGCTMGITEKGNYVTAAGAKPGDKLILTKSAGIEGTAILASDKEQQLEKQVSPKTLRKAKGFFSHISVVKEAIAAFKTGHVNAMHDPTEGGIIGGVYEMVEAAGVGVKIHEKAIPVRPETAEICKIFGINPLKLIGSGALLIAARPDDANEVIQKLRDEKIQAKIIGEVLRKAHERILVRRNGQNQALPEAISDDLWQALSKKLS